MFLDSADYLGILGNLAGCSDVGVIDFLICFGYLLVGESEKLVRIVTFVQRKYKRYGFIYRKICAKYYFPYAEGRQLIEGMEYKTYRKGDCLVREGERDTSFYIIARGIWRGHYLRDGQEVSVWFASEGEALFSTWGYVDNAVSRITIEAMSEAALYCMPKQKLEKLFASSVDFANLGRKLFEREFLNVETWLINGGASQARERYLALLEDNPELLRHVPLKYIASYLYITPQSLSRIRAELAKVVGVDFTFVCELSLFVGDVLF